MRLVCARRFSLPSICATNEKLQRNAEECRKDYNESKEKIALGIEQRDIHSHKMLTAEWKSNKFSIFGWFLVRLNVKISDTTKY